MANADLLKTNPGIVRKDEEGIDTDADSYGDEHFEDEGPSGSNKSYMRSSPISSEFTQ